MATNLRGTRTGLGVVLVGERRGDKELYWPSRKSASVIFEELKTYRDDYETQYDDCGPHFEDDSLE